MENERFKLVFDKLKEAEEANPAYKEIYNHIESEEIRKLREIVCDANKEQYIYFTRV